MSTFSGLFLINIRLRSLVLRGKNIILKIIQFLSRTEMSRIKAVNKSSKGHWNYSIPSEPSDSMIAKIRYSE